MTARDMTPRLAHGRARLPASRQSDDMDATTRKVRIVD